SPPFEQSNGESDLLHKAINSVRGRTSEAAITLSNRLLSADRPLPVSLLDLLRAIAVDPNPIVRSVVLYELPFIVLKIPELGWNLFHSALNPIDHRLWPYTERVFYCQYYKHYQTVRPLLERLEVEGHED